MSGLCVRVDATTGDAGRIGGVVHYITGPSLSNPGERLICSGNGNLLADTADGITKEMRSIADTSKALDSRVSIDPFEHFVISFEAGDAVNGAEFKRAIEIALKHLMMEDHPFIWGAHDDTGNLHLHLGLLRINPHTMRALSVPFAVKQAEQIGALINHEFGMQPMPNNRYVVDDSGNIEKLATSKVKEPNKLAQIIRVSTNWVEFHQRTRAIGINYDKKGNGALINGEKASDVDRDASILKLEKKWGCFIASPDAVEPSDVRPIHVERAIFRAAVRMHLSVSQHDERTAVLQEFKRVKSEIWQSSYIPCLIRIALSSCIACDQKNELLLLRKNQKQERIRLGDELDRKMPLLKKVEIENRIEGVIAIEIIPIVIREYQAFIDELDNRRVYYSTSENDKVDFIDDYLSVSILNFKDNAVLAALQLAQVKFGLSLTLVGSNKFKAQALKIAVANNIRIANTELLREFTAEEVRLVKERISVMNTKYESQELFKSLAHAVGAVRWRVALDSYVEVDDKDGKAYAPTTVLCNDQARTLTNASSGNVNHVGLSVAQVCEKWGYLERCQDDPKRARVTLTPESDSLHIVHLDGISVEKLAQLKADGFEPCAIIQTSMNKHSVLLTSPMDLALSKGQNHDISKHLSQRFNISYGDPEVRKAMQPFRAPGFENMKLKYKAEDGSYPVIQLKHAKRGDCKKLGQVVQEVRTEFESVITATLIASVKTDISTTTPAHGRVDHEQETKAYFAHVGAIRLDAKTGKLQVRLRKDGTLDQSSIDVLAAQRMRMTGWQHAQIVQAVAAGCNEVRATHGDTEKRDVPKYAKITADIAAKVDLTLMSHQGSYRLADERNAGVLSPIVAIEYEEQESRQFETLRYFQ